MPAWLTINDRWCDVREYRRRSQSRETETREKKKNKARTYLTPADLFQWRFSRTHTTIPHMPNKKDKMKNTEKKIIILNPFPSPAIKTKPDQTQYFSTNKFHIVVVFHSCARTLDRTHMNHNNNNNKTTAQNCENHSHRQVLALWFSCDRQNVYQAEDRPQVKLLFRFCCCCCCSDIRIIRRITMEEHELWTIWKSVPKKARALALTQAQEPEIRIKHIIFCFRLNALLFCRFFFRFTTRSLWKINFWVVT